MIANALVEYDDAVRSRWETIRIEPEKWSCTPWGDKTGGFWAVALDGGQVLWFNDIEDGFNWSRYSTRGTIDEYFSNQDAFAMILERIAQQNSERTRARLREGDVPIELAGPGTIGARQTTYWDVRARSELAYRIHFRDKAELAFAGAEYPSIEILDRHPLLLQYDTPKRSLYFSGTPLQGRNVVEAIERAIRAESSSWRGLHEYAGTTDALVRLLGAGHGMLMSAPEPVGNAAARVLEEHGVQCSILGHAPPRPGMRVLLLGRSYVVAAGFAFEVRSEK
jgi:hypothetical protein